MDLTEKREALIHKIEAAFADVPYPGDDDIGIHREGEIYVGHTDWRNIPFEFLRRNWSTMLDLTDTAYHFYLPAFICAVLEHSEAESDTIIFSLTPSPPIHAYRSRSDHAILLFTPAQKSVILEFLEVHSELFPYNAYTLFDDDKAELLRAILFWKNN